jgi:hypothetical protein
MVRTAKSSGGLAIAVQTEAEQALLGKIANDVDCRPCPQCGLIQPDMAARSKIRWHRLLFFIFVPLLLLFVWAAGSPEGVPIDNAAVTATSFAGVAALLHLFVALYNPNHDRIANQRRAEAFVAGGHIHLVKQGEDPQPPPANLTLLHGVILLVVLAASPAFLAPVLVRAVGGWQASTDVTPNLVGPGEKARLFFHDCNLESAKGLWRGKATVQVLNAEELGVAATLSASSAEETWGSLRTKTKQPSSTIKPYVVLTLPDDENLIGKELQLKATLTITYPTQSGKQGVEDHTATISREATVRLSTAAGAAAYRTAWTYGATSGLLAYAFGAAGLYVLAVMLRARALPSSVLSASGGNEPGPRLEDDEVRNAKRRWGQGPMRLR